MIFTPEAYRKIIDETIPKTLPAGDTNAIVLGVTQEGLRVAAHFERDFHGHWQMQGAYEHRWTGDNRIAGDVLYSF